MIAFGLLAITYQSPIKLSYKITKNHQELDLTLTNSSTHDVACAKASNGSLSYTILAKKEYSNRMVVMSNWVIGDYNILRPRESKRFQIELSSFFGCLQKGRYLISLSYSDQPFNDFQERRKSTLRSAAGTLLIGKFKVYKKPDSSIHMRKA